MTRGGRDKDREAPSERRCLVTGEVQPKTGLIRFVAGPDGMVVPDLAEKLPGRGFWVAADRAVLQKAADKGLFSRGAKAHVRAEPDLVDGIEAGLARRVIELISLSRKAGDAVAGTSLKWLCGGAGGCFLWVSPERVMEVEPVERGWFSHLDPFEMDIGHFLFAPDARRFWGGTPVIAPYVSALEGLRVVREIGVETIREHNLRLQRGFLDALSGTGIVVPVPGECGGTLCLELGQTVEVALAAAGVQCDRRGAILRLSFGIWNDDADIATVAQAVARSMTT